MPRQSWLDFAVIVAHKKFRYFLGDRSSAIFEPSFKNNSTLITCKKVKRHHNLSPFHGCEFWQIMKISRYNRIQNMYYIFFILPNNVHYIVCARTKNVFWCIFSWTFAFNSCTYIKHGECESVPCCNDKWQSAFQRSSTKCKNALLQKFAIMQWLATGKLQLHVCLGHV